MPPHTCSGTVSVFAWTTEASLLMLASTPGSCSIHFRLVPSFPQHQTSNRSFLVPPRWNLNSGGVSPKSNPPPWSKQALPPLGPKEVYCILTLFLFSEKPGPFGVFFSPSLHYSVFNVTPLLPCFPKPFPSRFSVHRSSFTTGASHQAPALLP